VLYSVWLPLIWLPFTKFYMLTCCLCKSLKTFYFDKYIFIKKIAPLNICFAVFIVCCCLFKFVITF
jgi:hypothetical protein